LGDLPFRDGSFDIALVFIAALQHVKRRTQRQDAFRQMARILREGGVLIIALDNIAPALSCYASWAAQKILKRQIRPATSVVFSQPQSEVSHDSADEVLTSNRSRMSAVGWRALGLARTLRWRTWEGVRDVGRRLQMVSGETGDTFIEQVSMPPTDGHVYYHLYRHAELLADAHVAGLYLLGYHSGNELAVNKTFGETARRLDKQVLYAFSR
jgi:SAM-dependent methyltransferase